MVRNLDHRFEVTAPIKDKSIQKELLDMLNIQLSDNRKARLINTEIVNQYKPKDKAEKKVRSQIEIYEYLKRRGEGKA